MTGLVHRAASKDKRKMLLRLPLVLLAFALSGCLSAIASNESTTRVRLGQIANLGIVRVTPLQVIEDSRCAAGAQCEQPGQVRIRATVGTPNGEHRRTLTLGRPQAIGGGILLLREVQPRPVAKGRIPRGDYSFVLYYQVPSAR
jgi:hypothetical protein